VIKSSFTQSKLPGAVLALKIISGQYITSAKRRRLSADFYKSKEPHDGWRLDKERHRTDVVIVLFNYFNLPREEHRDCTLPRNNF
jgi:hypothetical protein